MTTNEQSKYIGSKARITTTEGFIIEVVIEDSRVVFGRHDWEVSHTIKSTRGDQPHMRTRKWVDATRVKVTI
jgi:hypothetical protein